MLTAHSTRYSQPRDERMHYAIAVLTEGRSDAVGRHLRIVRKLDYKETRTNAPRVEEGNILGDDRGMSSPRLLYYHLNPTHTRARAHTHTLSLTHTPSVRHSGGRDSSRTRISNVRAYDYFTLL